MRESFEILGEFQKCLAIVESKTPSIPFKVDTANFEYVSPVTYLLHLSGLLSRLEITNQIKGIDVSHHQLTIDWNLIAAQGVKFCFIKASEGGDIRDELFERLKTCDLPARLMRLGGEN